MFTEAAAARDAQDIDLVAEGSQRHHGLGDGLTAPSARTASTAAGCARGGVIAREGDLQQDGDDHQTEHSGGDDEEQMTSDHAGTVSVKQAGGPGITIPPPEAT